MNDHEIQYFIQGHIRVQDNDSVCCQKQKQRAGNAGVPDVMRNLLEDWRRDEELTEERARQDEKQAQQTKRMEEQLHVMRRLL